MSDLKYVNTCHLRGTVHSIETRLSALRLEPQCEIVLETNNGSQCPHLHATGKIAAELGLSVKAGDELIVEGVVLSDHVSILTASLCKAKSHVEPVVTVQGIVQDVRRDVILDALYVTLQGIPDEKTQRVKVRGQSAMDLQGVLVVGDLLTATGRLMAGHVIADSWQHYPRKITLDCDGKLIDWKSKYELAKRDYEQVSALASQWAEELAVLKIKLKPVGIQPGDVVCLHSEDQRSERLMTVDAVSPDGKRVAVAYFDRNVLVTGQQLSPQALRVVKAAS